MTQHLDVLWKYLWENSNQFVENTHAFMNLNETRIVNEFPIVILCAGNEWLRHFVFTKHMHSLFGIDNPIQLKKIHCNNHSYYVSKYYFKINGNENFVEIIKLITTQKNIYGNRHCILIDNIELQNEHQKVSLKHLLEKFSNVAYFIITCGHMSKLPPWISSHCVFIKCLLKDNIQILSQLSDLKTDQLKRLLFNSDNDLISCMLKLTLLEKEPELFKGYRYPFMELCLDNLILNKFQNVFQYNEILIEYCTKINAACIPINLISLDIMYYIGLRRKHGMSLEFLTDSDMAKIVNICTKMDEDSIGCNKVLCVIENYIDDIVMILYNIIPPDFLEPC